MTVQQAAPSIAALETIALAGADANGSYAARWSRWRAERAASFWRELYLELRRHAGDPRLPSDFRRRLRNGAHAANDRWSAASRGAETLRLPRRQLAQPVAIELPAEVEQSGRRAAADAGVDLDAPLVALEVQSRTDLFFDAIDYLHAAGYTVVRIGEAAAGRVRRACVIDLGGSGDALAIAVLRHARFVVGESAALQRACYVTNTPSLTLNAPDVFSAYPVRADGLFTVRTPVDLDSGRLLTLAELLDERFFRNLRNLGYRPNTPAEILDAVREMHSGVNAGWTETPAQPRFRDAVVAAGVALAPRVPHIAKWGPDEGFIGHGRLAAVQAGRL